MEWWSDGVMGTGTVSPLPLRATYRSKVSRLAEISESQFKPQRRDERREAERSRIARSAWRLCSLLPLSNSGALTKAAASCAHSIRFAQYSARRRNRGTDSSQPASKLGYCCFVFICVHRWFELNCYG
jgi:hypothetical protein